MKAKISINGYTGTVFQDEDGTYIGIIDRLPGCSSIGDTLAEAYEELYDSLYSWIESANNAGNLIPAPDEIVLH